MEYKVTILTCHVTVPYKKMASLGNRRNLKCTRGHFADYSQADKISYNQIRKGELSYACHQFDSNLDTIMTKLSLFLLSAILALSLLANNSEALFFGRGRSTCSSGRQCRLGICRTHTNIFCGAGSK